MPQVQVDVTDRFPSRHLKWLTDLLQGVVAQQLTVPNTSCELNPEDVAVKVHLCGQFDRPTHDLAIRITAGLHPQRSQTLDERRAAIQKKVEEWLRNAGVFGVAVYVWVMLVKDSFGEFSM